MHNACWGFVFLMMSGAVGVHAQTKYNPQFGDAWVLAQKQHAPRRWLECVIRVKGPITDQTMRPLAATGFKRRSVITTRTGEAIITGRIQVRHVQQLVDLPLVLAIEGGGRGGKKGTQGMK